MGIPVMLLGESASGKTTSLRNFKPEEVGIFNPSKKPLPFRDPLPTINTDDYETIVRYLKKAKAKALVIDDSQYLMVNAFMRRSSEKGYDKYSEMAMNHWNLVQTVINDLPSDVIVYFLSHIERDQMGNEKAKTIGRMIDQYVTLEGLFTIVLKAVCIDGKYGFRTHTSGFDTVKTPLGMFEEDFIDNDLAAVDKVIREYYGLNAKEEDKNNA